MTSTASSHRRLAIAAACVVAAATLAAGCAEDEPAEGAATTTEAPAASSTTTPQPTTTLGPIYATLEVSLTSQQTQLHTVGADENMTYGWNQLTGTSEIDGEAAEVELLGSVDYVDGGGTWSGFLTISTDSGTLGLRAAGDAVLDATTKDTTFTGDLEVVGGSGAWEGVTGTATGTGTRDDALGGQVDFTFDIRLTDAES